MSLDDETLSDDIKQLIKERNVESIVFRGKQDSMNPNYTITYKQRGEDSGYVSYDFLLLNNYVKILGKQFIFLNNIISKRAKPKIN